MLYAYAGLQKLLMPIVPICEGVARQVFRKCLVAHRTKTRALKRPSWAKGSQTPLASSNDTCALYLVLVCLLRTSNL
ncbi:hypothetical protein E2C01_100815 [Portunus trituberculatus]|uniref:Uncharacterized protein n=1 Tax=Portunus trituberculatus TaxID=210409 RepID=A0A5B7KD60_PORTR|nr:hypothetical protein [Portunus trituberculatus]